MTIPIPSGNITDIYMIDENDSRKLDMTDARRRWWRWHFAGQAMQGLAEPALISKTTVEDTAKVAVLFADALLAELEKEKEETR